MKFELTMEQADEAAAVLNKERAPVRHFATCCPSWGLRKGGWGVVCDDGTISTLIGFDNIPVGQYRSIPLLLNTEEGYHSTGPDFGYHENIDDLKAEIDDYYSEDGFGPLNGYFTGSEA